MGKTIKERIPGLGVFLALLIAAVPACRPTGPGPSLIRIIDLVDETQVVRSPLRNPDPSNTSLAEIAGKDILEDLGTGANPFQIKRKLHVGPVDLNALVAVPPTEIRVRFRVPRDARLELTYGIRYDGENFGAEGGERRAEFSAILASAGAEETLLEKSLSLGPRRSLEFNFKRIDLSGRAGRDVELRLITTGDDKALAFWINPILYSVRRDARYVILISLDTLRPDHLGCYGYGRDTSPNIDALSRDGVRFAEVHSSAPWTLPAHVSLMTGLNSINHGVVAPEFRLDLEAPTAAELLRGKGFFHQAITGGGYVSGLYGLNRGFDSYRVVGSVNNPESAAIQSANACRWIADNMDKNLFLFLHSYQIHGPFACPEPYNRRYLKDGARADSLDPTPLGLSQDKRFTPVPDDFRENLIALYDAEIRYTDDVLIGSLVARLKRLGIYDRTMIILTSDHGEEFFEHGSWLHTHSLYGATARIALIIKFFGSRHAGAVVEDPASIVDIVPTLCAELEVDTDSLVCDGIDLGRLLRSKGRAERSPRVVIADLAPFLMNRHIPGKVALIRAPYKFLLNMPYRQEDLDFFANPPPPLPETEIFDLDRDPGEKNNLGADRPDLVRQYRELMKRAYRAKRKAGPRKDAITKDLEKQLKTLGYL